MAAGGVEMSQDSAKRLFAEGGFLVLLDVPEGTEIGIDYQCWSVGPRFKGIKMIPPGLHFVYYSAVSKEGQAAPRTGFFHFFHSREVLVRKWHRYNEEITATDEATVSQIKSNLLELDQYLGSYPFDLLKRWASLSNHISESLMERVQPLNGIVSSVAQLYPDREEEEDKKERGGEQPMDATDTTCESHNPSTESDRGQFFFAGVGNFPSDAERTNEASETKPSSSPTPRPPAMRYSKEAALRFTEIPQQKHPVGATPTQITKYNMDLSFTLDSMIHGAFADREKDVLGEVQLAFICFIVGQVYDGFEQWKRLVRLLCCCEDALSSRTDLYLGFISTLHFQLKEVPEDFFVDIVSRDNFLTSTLQIFFSMLEESQTANPVLVKRALRFRENLTKKFKWDFTVEVDEDTPTVVEDTPTVVEDTHIEVEDIPSVLLDHNDQ